jgi:hypothetical protein
MTIYTCKLNNGHIETKLEQALQNCMIFAGVTINFEIKTVPGKLDEAIRKWTKDQDLVNLVLQHLDDELLIHRVMIATDRKSLLAQFCRDKLPHAKWGFSYGYVSIDYAPREFSLFSQLHECLHFFGVEDCYDETTSTCRPQPNCDNPDCVMRYGIRSEEICSKVVSELKKYSENNS